MAGLPTKTNKKTKPKPQQTVAIIGAGVAGCAAAGALHDYGIDFVVFDKNDRAGGLWADNYPGAQVQSTPELYEYPCKKFPPEIRNRKEPSAPTATEVCTYLEEYIQEKGMMSKFRFNSVVSDVSRVSKDDWIVEFDDFSVRTFQFVIVCNGLVSCKPNRVFMKGQTDFQEGGGKILHSSERRSGDIGPNQRVLVIGNGKSAVDAATAAAEIANANGATKRPMQLARRQIWYVPRYLFGCLQYKWAFHTRLGSALLPRYVETTFILWRLLHFLFIPIKWIVWRILEICLLVQFRLPFRLWPKVGALESGLLETSALITDDKHLSRLRTGEFDMRIGEVDRLVKGKAILSTGDEEEVDVVILATGWELSYNTFMCCESICGGLDFCDDGLWLYRNILPPELTGIAFVGANTLTFMNIYTAYIQAYWLAQLLAGDRPWPKQEHMKETVNREKVFKAKYYKTGVMRGASIEGYMQHYHDVLFRDMRARNPHSCLIRPLADLLVPVIPSLMKGCLEPAKARNGKSEEETDLKRKATQETIVIASGDSSDSSKDDYTR